MFLKNMSGRVYWYIVLVGLCVMKVTGINFTISRKKVLLGSTGTLTLRCDITEIDVATVYNIQIKQLRSSTLSGNNDDDWMRLAFMKISTNENPTLDSAITPSDKDYVTGGSWDSTTPAITNLTLSMNMEKLVCADARTFKCELSYDNSQSTEKVSKHATFSAYVKPQVTSLVVRKNGFVVQGVSTSDMATAGVGDQLELACTANIGSLPGTIIQWHRTSETSPTDDFIDYQPPQGAYNEGTAVSDNQCGYTRKAWIKYNITAADANRDNNLAFECYVTVSGEPYGKSYTTENNLRFYTDVYNPGSKDGGIIMSTTDYPGSKDIGNIISTTDNPGSKDTGNMMSTTDNSGSEDSVITTGKTDENQISISAAVIAAIGIASLIVGVLIGVVFTLIILKRKQTGMKKLNEHQPTSVSRETELNVLSLSLNTYEQLQHRTYIESRISYDSLDANCSAVPDSQSQYESLKKRGGASQIYTSLENNR